MCCPGRSRGWHLSETSLCEPAEFGLGRDHFESWAMTPAIKAVKRARTPYRVHEYEHDPRADSYGLEAAEALGQDPGQVFKTLLAQLDGRHTVVAILPVESRLDLKALAVAGGAKKAAPKKK